MKYRKGVISIIVAMLFMVAGGVLQWEQWKKDKIWDQKTIYRNSLGEGESQEKLTFVMSDTKERYSYTLNLSERTLSKEEETETLQRAKQEIQDTFPGANKSMMSISGDVVMKQEYQNGMVFAEWEISCPELIGGDGRIVFSNLKAETQTEEAVIHLICGETKEDFTFSFCVKRPKESKEESLCRQIKEYIETQKQWEETVILPEQIGTTAITWQKQREFKGVAVMCLGILAAITVYYALNEAELRKQSLRRRKLLLEYPELVNQLALLLRAGMTIQRAFRKINERPYGKGKRISYIRLEIEHMLFDIDHGKSERNALLELSNRCEIWPYRKLVTLLLSSQKYGNQKLATLLENEADEMFLARKNEAKKLGEEAGTKLLFPMMILMLLVMGMIMVPAFMTMY